MHELGAGMMRVLRAVDEGNDRLPGIAAAAGLSVPRTSAVISGLQDRGFLEKRRLGMSGTVGFSGLRFAQLFRELVDGGFHFRECLTGSRMTLLAVIAGSGGAVKATDLAAYTGYSIRTIRELLRTAEGYGVLRRTDAGWALSSRMNTLSGFLKAYAEHVAGRQAGAISANALVNRIFGFEFVFSLPHGERPSGGVATAYSALSRDGVMTRGQRDQYHFSPLKRSPGREDFIYDLVLLDRGSVQNLTMALVYLKKRRKGIDARRLRMVGRVLGSPVTGDDMLRFVDGKGRDMGGFPDYEDFLDKYRMYGDAP